MNLPWRFLVACLALPTYATTEPRIAFDTHGGDAWTFELRVPPTSALILGASE